MFQLAPRCECAHESKQSSVSADTSYPLSMMIIRFRCLLARILILNRSIIISTLSIECNIVDSFYLFTNSPQEDRKKHVTSYKRSEDLDDNAYCVMMFLLRIKDNAITTLFCNIVESIRIPLKIKYTIVI